MKLRASLAVMAIASLASGCDTSDGKGDVAGTGSKSPSKGEVSVREPTYNWAERGLTKVSDAVDGISFSVSLPEELRRKEKKNDGTFPGYVTWTGPNAFLDPTFTAQIPDMPPADCEAAERRAIMGTAPREVLASGDIESGGFYVSMGETSKQYLRVEAWVPSASTKRLVRFSVGTRSKEAIEEFDALRLWMEKIVLSFEVQ